MAEYTYSTQTFEMSFDNIEKAYKDHINDVGWDLIDKGNDGKELTKIFIKELNQYFCDSIPALFAAVDNINSIREIISTMRFNYSVFGISAVLKMIAYMDSNFATDQAARVIIYHKRTITVPAAC